MSGEKMREVAEQAYTMTAHDYCANPVGSRDWTLFWRGYQAALAEQPGRGEADRSPEDEAERFIQAAIDLAPEPLRRLGEYLTSVLDEDQWKTAEPMLLGAAVQPAQGEAVAQIVNGELMWFIPHQSYALDAKFRSGRWMLYTAPPAPSVPEQRSMIAMVDAAMVEMANIHPPLKRSECERLIRAAMLASGGKASVPDDVAKDAARYRWLARHCRSSPEHWAGRWSIIIQGPCPKSHNSEDDFDAAIDAAMLAAAPEVPRG